MDDVDEAACQRYADGLMVRLAEATSRQEKRGILIGGMLDVCQAHDGAHALFTLSCLPPELEEVFHVIMDVALCNNIDLAVFRNDHGLGRYSVSEFRDLSRRIVVAPYHPSFTSGRTLSS